MKVERNSKEFDPIIITIESKLEAVTLWHCLNRSLPDRHNPYWEGRYACGFSDVQLTKAKDEMWETFDEEYRLEEE